MHIFAYASGLDKIPERGHFMFDFLSTLKGGELIGLAAVIMGPMVAIVAVIASQWRRVRVAEYEATLKQQMLDKGMSAAEIVQVMKATSDSSGEVKTASSGNEKLDRAALAQQMVENGY